MVNGERGFSGASFIRILIPFLRVFALLTYHLPKAPPPDSIILGGLGGFNMNLGMGGYTDIQTTEESTDFVFCKILTRGLRVDQRR